MTSIRLATAADAPVLGGLRFQFRASLAEAAETEEQFLTRVVPWMAARLGGDTSWRCWVADEAGTVAGHIWLQLIEKVPNPAPELEHHGYITNVFVVPSARGAGIGAALLGAALSFCRANRVDSVILWPTRESRMLYARHGFAVRDDIMEAVLDDGRIL